MFILTDITLNCGTADPITLDSALPNLTSTIVTLIKIGVPILLIIFGMLDLGKAVMAQKEDEIKKGWQTFIKRIIAAAIVFFVVVIVQLVINLVGGDNKSVWNCASCFINGVNSDSCEAAKS